MTYVSHSEDGDALRLSWGSGEAETFRPGDDEAMWAAYRKAVAHGLAEGECAEFDDVERSVAREIQADVGIRKDASDSLLVAWFPYTDGQQELAQTLSALCGGNVAPEDVHLTLLYLGDPDEDNSGPWDPQLLAAVIKIFTSRRYCNVEGAVSGLGRFVGPDDTDIEIALVDIPDLHWLRHCLKDELGYQGAVPYNSAIYNETHGYVPHLTVGYLPKTQSSSSPLDETIELEIKQLTLCVGEIRVTFDFPTTDDSAESLTPYYAARDALRKAYCPMHDSFECSHESLWERASVDPRKAGRVLAGSNLEALQTAHAAIGKVIESETSRGMSGPETPDAPTEKDRRAAFLKAVAGCDPVDLPVTYHVTKAVDEQRFTLGPLYAPERKDAHGEFTDAETLQKAVWDFVRESADDGRRLNLQHGDLGDIQVAEWVEVMAWPEEHTITVKTADGSDHQVDMPAGTVYLGAVWDEDAWPLVKAGKLNGWSLGGKAVRVPKPGTDLPSMGYKG